jgi:hypothetical protein
MQYRPMAGASVHGDSGSDANAKSNTHSHAESDADANSDAITYTITYTISYPNAKPNAGSGWTALGWHTCSIPRCRLEAGRSAGWYPLRILDTVWFDYSCGGFDRHGS